MKWKSLLASASSRGPACWGWISALTNGPLCQRHSAVLHGIDQPHNDLHLQLHYWPWCLACYSAGKTYPTIIYLQKTLTNNFFSLQALQDIPLDDTSTNRDTLLNVIIYPTHINIFCIYMMFFLVRGLDCCTDTLMASPYVQMAHTVDLLNPNVHQQSVHTHWLQFFEIISSFFSKIITTVSLMNTDRMTLVQQLTTHQIMEQSKIDRTMEMEVGRWQT